MHRNILLIALANLPVLGFCAPPADEPAKLTQDEAERLVFQSWREVRFEYNGETRDKVWELEGHRFKPDDFQSWARSGELVLHTTDEVTCKVIVDAKVDPIRLDIVYEGPGKRPIAAPGIVKFVKGAMIWVKAGNEKKSETYRQDGFYATRPTGFVADDTNHYIKRVLTPCKYLDD